MAPPLTETDKMLCIPVLAACMTAGVCDDAVASEAQFYGLKQNVEQAISFSGARELCLAELTEVFRECSDANWDGYDADPLDPEAVHKTVRFIHAWPTNLPYPEIGAMADGEISLDWYVGSRRSLTVAIGPHTRLAYAMINADEERSGTLSFTNENPKALIKMINELYLLG